MGAIGSTTAIENGAHQDSTDAVALLEGQGRWSDALGVLRHSLRSGSAVDAEILHLLGRLLQRLEARDKARRAYQQALRLDPSRAATYNNLALLELAGLNAQLAERWLLKGLNLPDLSLDQADLLHATACELYLYWLRPERALHFVELQLQRRVSNMALSNRAICYHKLGLFMQAVASQEQAIALLLQHVEPSLLSVPLLQLVARSLGDVEQSCRLQVQLMNLGIYRLLVNADDQDGLQLLLAGTANASAYWMDSRRSATRWLGQSVDRLILWDDQGYGDSIQNLAWIAGAARRAQLVEVWMRPSLLPLVQERCSLPGNVRLLPLTQAAEPWAQDGHQLGLFFLPMVLDAWPRQKSPPQAPWLRRQRNPDASSSRRVGLVWSAGRHAAPQPERSARVRDVPFAQLWDYAKQWRQKHKVECVSLQLDGHDDPEVAAQIQAGLLRIGLSSVDWLATAGVLETLDLVVSVDTSVAHLAGALGVPCVLLLSAPADWRWGQQGSTTPLYSSFGLARCQARDEWNTALKQADEWVAKILQSQCCDSAVMPQI